MKRKIIVFVLSILLLTLTPMVSAETVHMSGVVRFERENFTANSTVLLNLSDPEQIKQYSPAYLFWPSTADNGIIIDSAMPPDLLKIENTSSIILNATFTISPEDAADGASLFEFRLPVAVPLVNLSFIHLTISHKSRVVLDYRFNYDLLRSYGDPLSKYNVSYYNVSYLGYNLTLIYLKIRAVLLSGVTYNYSLQMDISTSAYVFAAGFDLFGDNVTGFTLNNKHYNGDAVAGLRILDMVSNGYGEFEQVYMQKQYALDTTYSGTWYVSFSIGAISRCVNQTVTVRVITLDSNGIPYAANSTTIHVAATGPIMLYGHVRLNFSGTNTIEITVYSNVSNGISVITSGEDTTPIQPDATLLTKSLVEVQKAYLSWYMDVMITTSKYLYPHFVRLPSSWEENVEIVFTRIGASALLPVVLTGLYTGITAAWLENYVLNLEFSPFIVVGQYIKSLIDSAIAGFKWFFDVIVSFLLDAVQYWLWIAEILVGTVINVFFWLLAAVLGNSMVNAFVRLPKDGINAVFEEFGKGLSTVNQILAPAKSALKKVAGVIK